MRNKKWARSFLSCFHFHCIWYLVFVFIMCLYLFVLFAVEYLFLYCVYIYKKQEIKTWTRSFLRCFHFCICLPLNIWWFVWFSFVHIYDKRECFHYFDLIVVCLMRRNPWLWVAINKDWMLSAFSHWLKRCEKLSRLVLSLYLRFFLRLGL